jgi:hypothetical protein
MPRENRRATQTVIGAALSVVMFALCSSSAPAGETPSSDYDLIIEHGRVVDGTGAP